MIILLNHTMSVISSTTTSMADTDSHWTRLNYGVVATKLKTICAVQGQYPYTFQITLPVLPPPQPNITVCNESCRRMPSLFHVQQQFSRALYTSVAALTERIYETIPDAIQEPRANNRRTRGLFNIVGRFHSWAWGTATEGDINELRRALNLSHSETERSFREIQQNRKYIVEINQYTNNCLDQLHAAINAQDLQIHSVVQELREQVFEINDEYAAIAAMSLQLIKYFDAHETLRELESALEDLLKGHLTPRLIDQVTLGNLMRKLNNLLKHYKCHLCAQDLADVYRSPSFDLTRSGRNLFIRIWFPYTKHSMLNVFKTHVLSLPVIGTQGLTTTIKDFPEFVAIDQSNTVIAVLTESPKVSGINADIIKWFKEDTPSCVTAVILDRPNDVSSHCDFVARKAVITPQLIRIKPNVYVISNFTDASLKCQSSDIPRFNQSNCIPCIFTLPCDCSLGISHTEVIADKDCLYWSNEIQPLHAVNLIVLQKFYDMENITLSGKALITVPDLPSQQLLHIPLFGNNVSRALAADTAIAYSLNKIAKAIQNDSVIFHSAGEAKLHEILNKKLDTWSFDFGWPNMKIFNFQWTPYLIAILYIVNVFYALVLAYLFRTIRLLSMGALLSTTFARTNAFQLRTTEPTTISATTPNIILTMLADIRRFDLIVAIFMIVVTILFFALIYAIIRSFSRRSYLYLDISDDEYSVQIHWFTFPDPSRRYNLQLTPGYTLLALRSFCIFGILTFNTPPWRLQSHKLTFIQYIPTIAFVPPWHIKLLKKIITSQNYSVLPLLVHSHEHISYEKSKPSAPASSDFGDQM